jgi:hypothetical protein
MDKKKLINNMKIKIQYLDNDVKKLDTLIDSEEKIKSSKGGKQ